MGSLTAGNFSRCAPAAVLALAAFIACGSHGHDTTGARTPSAAASGSASAQPGEADRAAREQAEDAQIPAWYDVQPRLASVRPEVLRALEATTGPLAELPLYDFDLDVDASERTFRLSERVFFENRSNVALRDVVLRVYANTPRGGEPPETLVSGHCVQSTCTVEPLGRDAIVVHPAQPIAPKGRLRIVLHVAGTLRAIDASRTTMMAAATSSLKTMMAGGSETESGDYGLLGAGDDILSFGNFYPVLARHHGDDWDVDPGTLGDIGPDALAHVHARVTLPEGYVAAASGVVSHQDEANGRRHLEIEAGCMRDFALLASDKFAVAERDVDGVTVRSYFRISDRTTGDKVLDVAAWALRDFQKRFGVYPYRDLDLAEEALVGGAGGVEFAGLATVASMFYKPSGSPSGSGGGLEALLGGLMGSGGNDGPMKASAAEFTTAHEVSHQWWHGVVGSDSRLHPWQDEALAQFSAMLYIEDRYGAARAKREADMNARMGYEMMRLLGQPDGAVDAPAGKQSQLAYGGLVYGKGPYYFVALRKLLGDSVFFGALQAYVKQYYLGFAPPRAFVDAATRLAGNKGDKVAALSRRWLEEAHGDDDLGRASFGSLLAMAGGGAGGKGGADASSLLGGGAGGAPDMQQMMKMLGGGGNADIAKLLQQLMGGGGPGGAGGGGDDTQQLLQQMLGP